MSTPGPSTLDLDGTSIKNSCLSTEGFKENCEPSETRIYPFQFHGNGQELFQIFIFNIFFTAITFGIYGFCGAKVRTRRYIWSNTSFAGHRFSYHGTGVELFIGLIKGVFLIGLLASVLIGVFLTFQKPYVDIIATALIWFEGAVLISLAQFGLMKYRLSRTSWCAIRFTFRGKLFSFLKVSLKGLFLTAISFGFYFPDYHREIRAFFIQNTFLGTVPFSSFDQRARNLWCIHRNALWVGLSASPIIAFWFIYGPWENQMVGVASFLFLCVALAVFSLWMWVKYLVNRQRFYWSNTYFPGAIFQSTVTESEVFKLMMINFFLIIGTLGLGQPWVKVRTLKYYFKNLCISGNDEFRNCIQMAGNADSIGDEIGGMLAIEEIFGL